jgi:hypothetical protein
MNLKSVSDRIAKLIQERQKKLAPRKTGALAGSIKTNVDITKKKITISSKMFDYGYFQDSGISGIRKRVNKNPQSFNPPGQFSGEFKMIGGNLPFGARVSIYRDGIQPQPFIVPATLQVMDRIGYQLLADEIAENVALEFKQL